MTTEALARMKEMAEERSDVYTESDIMEASNNSEAAELFSTMLRAPRYGGNEGDTIRTALNTPAADRERNQTKLVAKALKDLNNKVRVADDYISFLKKSELLETVVAALPTQALRSNPEAFIRGLALRDPTNFISLRQQVNQVSAHGEGPRVRSDMRTAENNIKEVLGKIRDKYGDLTPNFDRVSAIADIQSDALRNEQFDNMFNNLDMNNIRTFLPALFRGKLSAIDALRTSFNVIAEARKNERTAVRKLSGTLTNALNDDPNFAAKINEAPAKKAEAEGALTRSRVSAEAKSIKERVLSGLDTKYGAGTRELVEKNAASEADINEILNLEYYPHSSNSFKLREEFDRVGADMAREISSSGLLSSLWKILIDAIRAANMDSAKALMKP